MEFVPNFDPLMLIVGVFALLALLQHLGFVNDTVDPSDARSARRERPAGGDAREPESAKEATAEELVADAERCIEQNSYARAQELAKQATALDPESIRAWELLATAQKWEGQRDDAAATVRKARELYELDSAGLRELAQELEGAQDVGTVAAESEEKGEKFMAARQFDLAAECFARGVEAFSSCDGGDKSQLLRLLRRQAECAQQLQDWGTCRRAATKVLEDNPRDPAALLQRAAANEALERFQAALDDARTLLAIDPKSKAANRIAHSSQQALRG